MRLSIILAVAALALAGCNANELPDRLRSVGPLRRLWRPGSHPSGADKRLLRRPLTNDRRSNDVHACTGWPETSEFVAGDFIALAAASIKLVPSVSTCQD